MFRPLTLVSLLSLIIPALSSPCVVFDADFNLYAFGLNGKDWSAGAQDSWTSGTATDVTASGRPPFDGAGTTCYMAQFYNAIYVMNGDASNPSAVHIYNAAAKSWSTQSVTVGTFDPSSFDAILDHDTNVFYALSKGELFFLDMGALTSANASALSWVDVEKAPYPDGYQPVMALAQNHIHFLDVPGTPAGDADIFVIHFSFFQPEPQSYPLSDGSAFPATHGQATSFFQATTSAVQQEFAFIPDDGSATYVINVETNSTQALPGPATKDAKATYAAGVTALVQLDSTGAISFLPYKEGDAATNAQASWTKVSSVAAAAPPGSGPSSSSGSSPSSTKSHASVTNSGASGATQSSSSAQGSSGSNGAAPMMGGTSKLALVGAGVLGIFAALL